jgi:ribosomal protein S18 acetylase RimI-like enzyme
MKVRLVRREEYDQAGRVTADAYLEFAPESDPEWDAYLAEIGDVAGRAGRMPVLVATEDGLIPGSATVEMDDRVMGDDDETLPPEMACLRMLGVDPGTRGRGVGRALVQASIELARAEGKTVMTLRTTDAMHDAQHLYRSMGFERDPDRDHVFDNGFRLIAYRRPI